MLKIVMKNSVFIFFLGLICFIGCSIEVIEVKDIEEPKPRLKTQISIYNENPFYWYYKDEPVILLGGSYDDNMFQFPNWYYDSGKYNPPHGLVDWTLEEHLDKLVDAGGNYIRNTMSSRNPGNRYPFLKTSGTPGDNKDTDVYDLDQWDDEYWNRLDHFLNECYERDIIVQLEIWDRFDFFLSEINSYAPGTRGRDNTGWESNPYNPLINSNYTSAESGLPNVVDYTPGSGATVHPFFHSVPALAEHQYAPEPIVLEYQEKYVEKLLSISLGYPNVIYCANNETPELLEWGAYWVQFVRNKASEVGKTIFVSDMRRHHNFTTGGHPTLMQDEFYDFFEVSQASIKNGEDHYNTLIYARDQIILGDKIKPINSIKIYNYETEALARMWRMIFAGLSSARFHRSGYTQYFWGWGLHSTARTHMKSLRMLLDNMFVFSCVPDNTLLSNRSTNEAYCLAEPGEQYAVYFSNGGSVSLNISEASGDMEMRWLNISQSEWETPSIINGSSVTLTTPSDGEWAVLITKK